MGGTTSADIAYGVFTWFTPAGYVFATWSLIYVAMVVWLVAYTRTAPVRADRFTMTSILFIASCALNVLWLALWHFELVAVSFIVILAEWLVLAALYLNVRRTMKTASGRVPCPSTPRGSRWPRWPTWPSSSRARWTAGIPFFNGLFTILLTAGVLAFGYVMRKAYDDMAFQLVFLWALIGVGVNVSARRRSRRLSCSCCAWSEPS